MFLPCVSLYLSSCVYLYISCTAPSRLIAQSTFCWVPVTCPAIHVLYYLFYTHRQRRSLSVNQPLRPNIFGHSHPSYYIWLRRSSLVRNMAHSQDQAVRTTDVARTAHTEAPVSMRSYLICAFASFGGILFGYDSGYINGVLGMVRMTCMVK